VTRETFSGFSSIKRIERDKKRFDAIIRGRIKQDLRKHITRGELIGKRGREVVSIPLPQIELPHLKYGKKGMSGVGQGDGAEGTPLGQGDDEGGAGAAGDQPGAHIREVEVSIQELAELLGEELEPAHRAAWQPHDQEPSQPLQDGPQHGPREPALLQAHLPAGAQAPDRLWRLRFPKADGDAGARRLPLPILEGRAGAGGQRGHHLHDGRIRLDG
jgi:hypothetical protein